MSKPTKIKLRVEKGALVPANEQAREYLRKMGVRVGDEVMVEVRKARNSRFHRLVHQLGALAAQNIEAFSGMDAHAVLKKIQLEGRIACDQQVMDIPGIGAVMVSMPKSLSYDSMNEDEFRDVAGQISRWLVARYWPDMSPERIEAMAETMIE